jgi:hypothetical protein
LDAATRGLGADARAAAAAQHCFQLYDLDASGSIEAAELAPLLRSLRIDCPEEEVLLLVAAMDSDGSGDVDYAEFAAWCGDESRSNTHLYLLFFFLGAMGIVPYVICVWCQWCLTGA